MLDCGLDLTPSLSFLPLSVVESRPRGEPVDKPGLEGELRDCGGTVLVDSQPEVLPPQVGVHIFLWTVSLRCFLLRRVSSTSVTLMPSSSPTTLVC